MRKDWINKELGKVCFTTSGGTPSRKVPEYYEGDIPWVKSGELNHNIIRDTEEHISEEAVKNSSAKIFPEGTLLIALYGATIGKLAVLGIPATTNQAVCGIFKNDLFVTKFLFNYLFHKKQKLIEQGAGGAQPNISQTILKKLPVPIAPIPEQRAIVAKIEQLFSELDNGIANLKAAKDKLEIYRQAVLKKAFEGELTKKWRMAQNELPTAEELLEPIKEERLNHYKAQLNEWEESVVKWELDGKKGKKPSKPKKVKALPKLTEKEINELNQLPDEWKWVKVDSIQFHDQYSIKAGPFGSSLKKSFYVEYGYKIYGQEQVIAGDCRIGDYYIDQVKFDELKSCAVQPKDVLISLVGTVGKVLVMPDGIEPGIINPRLIKISLAQNFYDPIFFKYYFESAYLKSLYANKSHGATMDIINLGIIQELPFPLLTTNEQLQIIQEIEYRLSVCDNILANIEEGLEKSEALRQSILKKAFEGKLLKEEEIEACRNESDWEPAEELLKRIKTK